MWQFLDDRPIYAQLIEQIQRAVVNGAFPPGSKLPGVRELATEAGVNPNTMQRALAAMEEKGILYTQRTSGRFVTEDAALIARLREELGRGVARRFLDDTRALGYTTGELQELICKVEEET